MFYKNFKVLFLKSPLNSVNTISYFHLCFTTKTNVLYCVIFDLGEISVNKNGFLNSQGTKLGYWEVRGEVQLISSGNELPIKPSVRLSSRTAPYVRRRTLKKGCGIHLNFLFLYVSDWCRMTEGYSGSDLTSLAKDASLGPIRGEIQSTSANLWP